MNKMNCIWLNEQNPYDLLCKAQDILLKGGYCILTAITGIDRKCPKRTDMTVTAEEQCHHCIQAWMIEKQ